jgi:hypothetical protein
MLHHLIRLLGFLACYNPNKILVMEFATLDYQIQTTKSLLQPLILLNAKRGEPPIVVPGVVQTTIDTGPRECKGQEVI